MKVFWFHYNKPASKKMGKPQITIHYNNQCIIVDNLICKVETFGHIKKSQPYFVIKGKCKEIKIDNKIATIL